MTLPRGVSSFIATWARSRPTHVLHRAIFVVLFVGVIAVPAIVSTPKSVLLSRYSKAGFAALRKEKTEAAELYFRRMGRLDAAHPDGQYGMALTAAHQENKPLAFRLMQNLANGEPKHLLAHDWLADAIVGEKSGKLSDDDFWALRRHLELSSKEASISIKARAMLGTMLLARGDFHDAIPHLESVVDQQPRLRIALSRAYATVDRQKDASEQIALALNHFRQFNISSPGNPDGYLTRVQCELMSGNTAVAERVLGLACERFPDDVRFTLVLQDLHLTGCDEALKGGNHNAALRHLDQALGLNPQTPGLMERFAYIASGDNDSNELALKALHEVAVQGTAPATAHLAIGGVMLKRNQLREAAAHFEIGLRHNPDSVALLNNLAWCLCKNDQGDKQKALQLIDKAMRRATRSEKQQASVRETRGQILAKLGRTEEAAVELERALPLLSRSAGAHETLAQLYASLGQDQLAEQHRRKRTVHRLADDPQNTRNR